MDFMTAITNVLAGKAAVRRKSWSNGFFMLLDCQMHYYTLHGDFVPVEVYDFEFFCLDDILATDWEACDVRDYIHQLHRVMN